MNRFRTIALLCAALIPGGCEAVAMGVAAPMIIQQKHVNLTNASYAAVDTLVQQSGKRFDRGWPLIVSDLQEIVDTTQTPVITNPKVGRILSGQMRDRFVQLGYNVSDAHSYEGGGNGTSGEVLGTYEILNGTMTVMLKMTDRSDGHTITVFDYSLPVTYDIKKYMTPNANMLPAFPPLL